MDHKKSILLNSFVEYLRSLLVMVEQNYTYESVFRYLRTSLCGFTRDEVDRLENYCLALDLKGFKKWDQVWVRKTPMTTKEELEELNHLRMRLWKTDTAAYSPEEEKKDGKRDHTCSL